MGYHLKNERGEELEFTVSAWRLALEIAERHGWNPAGTIAPGDWEGEEEWEGDYFTMDGQRVSPEDAARLAVALEKALADPHFAAKTREAFNDLQDEAAGNAGYKRVEYSLKEAGEFGGRVKELIEFARGTIFVIE